MQTSIERARPRPDLTSAERRTAIGACIDQVKYLVALLEEELQQQRYAPSAALNLYEKLHTDVMTDISVLLMKLRTILSLPLEPADHRGGPRCASGDDD